MFDDHFGVDVEDQLKVWWTNEFLPSFFKKYGEEAVVAVAVFEPGQPLVDMDWENPLGHPPYDHIRLTTDGDTEIYEGDEGLFANIGGKLRFVFRTGLNSSEAANRLDLAEPGDFPREGAGIYRDYPGGASGLLEECDWWVYRQVVNKLIELRAAAAKPVTAASRAGVEGFKYLPNQQPNEPSGREPGQSSDQEPSQQPPGHNTPVSSS